VIARLIARNETPFRHPADLLGVITLLVFSVTLAPGAWHGSRGDRGYALRPSLTADPSPAEAAPDAGNPEAKRAAALEAAFNEELAMDSRTLMRRWDPLIAQAARRFDISENWIRSVMRMESGGRTMLDRRTRIVSRAGAMGLMQVMPQTYRDMRVQYGLGRDAYDPRNNIFAGAAYLKMLYRRYGYPAMFAAYNDGPGNLEDHLYRGRALPGETQNYVASITGRSAKPAGAAAAPARVVATFSEADMAQLADALARVAPIRMPGPYAGDPQIAGAAVVSGP
jgi:soluble lytic murein transglycosylase-like protein